MHGNKHNNQKANQGFRIYFDVTHGRIVMMGNFSLIINAFISHEGIRVTLNVENNPKNQLNIQNSEDFIF